MVTLAEILELLNRRKSRVLRLAESALPPSQFRAFRRLFLDEFGREGLERELEELHAEPAGRNGQADTRKKGGAP